MNPLHREGLMAKTIRDSLGQLLPAGMDAAVLELALERSGMSAIPPDLAGTRHFVTSALKPCVDEMVGRAAADELERVLLGLLSPSFGLPVHDRATLAPPATRRRVEEEEAKAPLVVVASLDRTGVRRIARSLGGDAEVRRVKDVFELASVLEAEPRRRLRVVVDCCAPGVDPSSMVEMVPNLPRGRSVILWGADENRRLEIEEQTPAASDWIVCSEASSHEDIAALIRSIL